MTTKSIFGYALVTYVAGIFLLVLIALAVSGCTAGFSAAPSTGSQQMVYSAENDFAAALRIAVAYESLPQCGANPAPCSNPATVTQITAAAKAARLSLSTAEAAVRSSSNAAALTTAALQAQSDVAAFSALANALGK